MVTVFPSACIKPRRNWIIKLFFSSVLFSIVFFSHKDKSDVSDYLPNPMSRNCLADSIARYGSFYTSANSRPVIFSIRSSSFQAVFFSVPGDEKTWNSLDRYKWEGHTSTLIFVGELFRRAIRQGYSKDDMALIDVGANMGQEVVVAAMLGFQSTTFELLPRSVQTIRFNLAANCVPDRHVTIVNAAVAEKSGILPFETQGFSPSKRAVHQKGGERQAFNATVWSLDDYFLNNNKPLTARPLLFKLDCERCEYEALEGSMRLLEQYPPHYIMVEYLVDKSLRETLEGVKKKGYSRVFVLSCGDEWIVQSDVAQYEKKFGNKASWIPWDSEKQQNCDLVLVHNDAIDLGLFPILE